MFNDSFFFHFHFSANFFGTNLSLASIHFQSTSRNPALVRRLIPACPTLKAAVISCALHPSPASGIAKELLRVEPVEILSTEDVDHVIFFCPKIESELTSCANVIAFNLDNLEKLKLN